MLLASNNRPINPNTCNRRSTSSARASAAFAAVCAARRSACKLRFSSPLAEATLSCVESWKQLQMHRHDCYPYWPEAESGATELRTILLHIVAAVGVGRNERLLIWGGLPNMGEK
jgi:hypothetical protein